MRFTAQMGLDRAQAGPSPGGLPESLAELVERRYLRQLPMDPITQSSRSWVIVPPEPPARGQVYDIRSGARGAMQDGRPFGSL